MPLYTRNWRPTLKKDSRSALQIFCNIFYIQKFAGPSQNLAQIRAGVKIVTFLPEDKRVIVDIQNAKKDPVEVLSKLSQIHGVKRVDDIKIRKIFNNIATGVMNANDIGNTLLV